jgi:hypothetical protein
MGKNTLVISSASTMDDTYVQKMAKSKTRKQKKITRKSLEPYCFSIISSLLTLQYSIEAVDSQKNSVAFTGFPLKVGLKVGIRGHR